MSHCQTCHGGCWIDPAKPSTSDNWTRMGKIVQWFDRLSQADFRNGAVRDEIRKYLMDLEAKDAAIAQAVAQEREACLACLTPDGNPVVAMEKIKARRSTP